MPIVFNPGTAARPGATAENAEAVMRRLAADVRLLPDEVRRDPTMDDIERGRFGFVVRRGSVVVEIQIPGDDPDEVAQGRPFVSRRLYVDGSSWLYGYALNIIEGRLSR